MTQTLLAILAIVLSGACYGSLGLLGTKLLHAGFSLSNMLFWRFGTASLTVFIFGLHHLRSLGWMDFRSSLVGAFLYSLSSILYFVASNSIGTGLGMVIFYSYPVFIFLYLGLFLKQPISKLSWVSLVTVCFGLYLLNHNLPMTQANHMGIVIALLSAGFYAAYILISKKQANQLNPHLTTFVLCLVSSIYFFTMAQTEGTFTWPRTPHTWAIAFALGFLATSFPILLMLLGLKYVGAEIASILSLLEPIITVLLGVIFLSESLNWIQSLGIGVVLLGAIGSTLSMKEKKPTLIQS